MLLHAATAKFLSSEYKRLSLQTKFSPYDIISLHISVHVENYIYTRTSTEI
jgi:hypothetical protein